MATARRSLETLARDYLGPVLDLPTVERTLPKVRRMLRRPLQELRNNLAVIRDLERFKRDEVPQLTEAAGNGPRERTVLIVSLSPIIYRVKLEVMFAVAMARNGCRPVVLTTRATGQGYPYSYIEYFRALPFVETVLLEDLSPGPRAPEVQRDARELAARFREHRDWNALAYRGTDLGRHVRAGVCRNLRLAEVDPDASDVRGLMDRLLPHFLARAIAADTVFERWKPAAAFFQDVIYLNYGPIFEAALKHGVDVVQHMPCQWQDNSLVFRRFTSANRLEHPNSLSRQTWREFLHVPWSGQWMPETKRMIAQVYGCHDIVTKRNQGGKSIRQPDEVRAELGIPAGKFVACIFSHILWDSSGAFGDDLYPNFAEWLVDTLRTGMQNPDVYWILKLHPDSRWKQRLEGWSGSTDEVEFLESRLGKLPEHVRIVRPDTPINTYSLFAVIDCGITVKGSIAYQLPVYGVRVLTAGRSKFFGMGFTDDSVSVDEYRRKLSELHRIGRATEEQTERAVRYVFAQFLLKPWEHTLFRMRGEHSDTPEHPLWWDLRMPDGSQRDFTDLDALAYWILNDRRDDYLELKKL